MKNKLSDIIRERQLNISEISRKTKISRKTIYRVMQNYDVNVNYAIKLAKYLNMSVEELFS